MKSPRRSCRSGSVLLYTGVGIPRRRRQPVGGERIGLNITYSLAWLRQEENQYLSCPPEIARGLPRNLQDLLGYAVGSYALGYYTPPLPPGPGPEAVPPEFALGRSGEDTTMGDAELLAAITAEVAAN